MSSPDTTVEDWRKKVALWFWKYHRVPAAKAAIEAYLDVDITDLFPEDIKRRLYAQPSTGARDDQSGDRPTMAYRSGCGKN